MPVRALAPTPRPRSGDYRYGLTCPICAEPKTLQAARCMACYHELRRAGAFPPPPNLYASGAANPSWKGGVTLRPTGAPRGRPQPADHPFRRAQDLLFAKRAA